MAVVDCWAGWQPAFTPADRQHLAAANALAPLVLVPNQAWARAMTLDELGVAAVLPKPFEIVELLGAVASLRQP